MVRKKPKSPKRKAKQKRSKETIEFILTAAGLVLDKHGYPATTTDRIAERAGVSVGTIYQYFNNKDEILEQFLSREANKVLESMSTIVSMPGQSKRFRLSTFIRSGGPEYLTPKAYDELSKVSAFEKSIMHLSASVVEITESLIQSIRPDLPSQVVHTYALLLVTTAQGLRAASETGADEVLVATYIEMFEKFLLRD